MVFRYDTEAECFWRAYRGALDASRIYIIPNGYESPIEQYVHPAGERCTILYAGTLPDYRYDTLLKSLSVLKETDPSRAKQLRLLFVGEGMDALANEAAALGLSDMIETEGPKPYAEIARLQREAHALLVLGRPATMKGYELFAGAKLFGYLKAGRPIVGVLPPDETKKVLHRVGVRTVADVDSVPEITAVLCHVLEKWSTGTLPRWFLIVRLAKPTRLSGRRRPWCARWKGSRRRSHLFLVRKRSRQAYTRESNTKSGSMVPGRAC